MKLFSLFELAMKTREKEIGVGFYLDLRLFVSQEVEGYCG